MKGRKDSRTEIVEKRKALRKSAHRSSKEEEETVCTSSEVAPRAGKCLMAAGGPAFRRGCDASGRRPPSPSRCL